MRRVIVFEQLSLDGYYVDRHGDMTWAKEGSDEESEAFASSNASGDGLLAFGRVTYEMMSAFWPTPEAHAMLPIVAESMNRRRKIVFSKHLERADWNNTTPVRDDAASYLRRAKAEKGPDIVILGSGSVVASLAPHGIIDEYQLMLCPLALGGGRSMFRDLPERLRFTLNSSRVFGNGKIFLSYAPA